MAGPCSYIFFLRVDTQRKSIVKVKVPIVQRFSLNDIFDAGIFVYCGDRVGSGRQKCLIVGGEGAHRVGWADAVGVRGLLDMGA